MSLIVYLIAKNKDICIEEYEKELPIHFNEAFGFENCRKSLWGLGIVKELECKMIYSLREQDIYAFDEQIEELEKELNMILVNKDKISDTYDAEFIEERVNNALQIIAVAKKHKHILGVTIG